MAFTRHTVETSVSFCTPNRTEHPMMSPREEEAPNHGADAFASRPPVAPVVNDEQRSRKAAYHRAPFASGRPRNAS